MPKVRWDTVSPQTHCPEEEGAKHREFTETRSPQAVRPAAVPTIPGRTCKSTGLSKLPGPGQASRVGQETEALSRPLLPAVTSSRVSLTACPSQGGCLWNKSPPVAPLTGHTAPGPPSGYPGLVRLSQQCPSLSPHSLGWTLTSVLHCQLHLGIKARGQDSGRKEEVRLQRANIGGGGGVRRGAVSAKTDGKCPGWELGRQARGGSGGRGGVSTRGPWAD